MKLLKLMSVSAVAVLVTACSSTDPYQRRAEEIESRREAQVERSIDKAPKWMTELPKSTNAVYAHGSAVSGDMSMSAEKAKLVALSNICMAAGGEVDKKSKMFLQDTETGTSERSEMAIQALCQRVDVSGAELVEVKRIAEGTRFRTYVLMALPTGEANQIAVRNDRRRKEAATERRAADMFQELDANRSKQ
jgi:hypothetical protein